MKPRARLSVLFAFLWIAFAVFPSRLCAKHLSDAALYVVVPEAGSVLQKDNQSPTDVLIISYLTDTFHDHIQRVEIWGDEKRLGTAERSANTPNMFDVIHRLIWRNVPAGEHVVQARGYDAGGNPVVFSTPVRWKVLAPSTNRPPEVRLALQERAVWFTPGVVPLTALASDTDGFVALVRFYAGDILLGSVTNRCPACENFPHVFEMDWVNPPPGNHTLTAVAVDNLGSTTKSEPAQVVVQRNGGVEVPVVTVTTEDGEALEADRDPKNHRFESDWLGSYKISRTGKTDADLTVWASFGGKATRGVDYHLHPDGWGPCELPCRRADRFIEDNVIIIPAGQSFTYVLVRGLPDLNYELRESVTLRIEEDPSAGPIPRYRIGTPDVATLDIVDATEGFPRVTLLAPSANQVFKTGGSIQIEMLAEDPPGIPTTLVFTVNGMPLHNSGVVVDCACPNGAPVKHSFLWTNVPAGNFSLGAYFTSRSGKQVYAAETPVQVEPDANSSPQVQFLTPRMGTTFSFESPIRIALASYSPTNSISGVRVSANGEVIGVASDCCPACDCIGPKPGDPTVLKVWEDWIPDQPGTYILSAKPFDETSSTWAPPRTEIQVVPPAGGASVALRFPTDGTWIQSPRQLTFIVNAWDAAGHIPRVEYFAHGTKIGESRVEFVKEPDPGTPVKHEWKWMAQRGIHQITLRGHSSTGKIVESGQSTRLTVEPLLDLNLRMDLGPAGHARFVVPHGSLTVNPLELFDSFDLKTWRKLGPMNPGAVAAFYELDTTIGTNRTRFFRAVESMPGR